MEKAILKTLTYYDFFDFPLKAWEIHKWLTGQEKTLTQVEAGLKKLQKKNKIKVKKDYYFLNHRKGLAVIREQKERLSATHNRTAFLIGNFFKIIPWIKLVGISGSLSMMGSYKKDDIDLFIITQKNRIWLSRMLLMLITALTGLRRKRREKILEARGKICINLILETDNLALKKRNIYVAHEVLQMRPIWQRDQIYSEFLHENSWAFKYLPNWKSGVLETFGRKKITQTSDESSSFINWLEQKSKSFQLKIMKSPTGSERIESGALFFHPEDKGQKILQNYKARIKNL